LGAIDRLVRTSGGTQVVFSDVRIAAIALTAGLAAALPSLCLAQKLSGSYTLPDKSKVDWSINGHSTLIWGGAPYLPVGLESDSDRGSIQAAKAAGISDLVVDLPASSSGWKEAIQTLEQEHMRYLVRISSLTPMAEGVAVDPAAYRISNVEARQHVDVPLPGATEALVVSALKRDGSLISYIKVPVTEGRLICDIKSPADESVVLIYPTEQSLEQPDYWEGLDAQRDRLLETLKSCPTGPGLRGIVNPLGNTLSLPGRDLRFVPQSAGFRSEFATFLEVKYRNIVGVLRAWSMPPGLIAANETGDDKSSLVNFDDIAKFIPLWSGNRGIGQVYDPKKNVLYNCDNKRSAIWKDMADCISAAENRRYERMVKAIRDIDDVPVVQEWAGWAVPYEGLAPSVDGVGMKAKGTSPSGIASTAAKATSSILRWSTPGWLPATDIDLVGSDSSGKVSGVLDDLTSLGARGVFFRAKSASAVKEVSAAAAARSSDISASQGSPSPIFYPENATNPAETQRLPGGFWWLPAPFDGDRIDYGDGFFGYRMTTPKGVTVTLWADKTRQVLLKMANPKKLTASTLGGSATQVKISKDGVELTLSETPLVLSTPDEIPVPQAAYEQTLSEILVLLENASKAHKEFPDVTMMISDAKAGYERNPGAAFVAMRRLLHQLDSYMGRFTWTEMETPMDTNFSEVSSDPSCSNSKAISLRPLIDAPAGFFATYETPIHTEQDEEIWMAAKINPEDIPLITFDIAGQHLTIHEAPVGVYGSGFGWYHLGTTRNAVGTTQFKLTVASGKPDLSADAVLFCPPGFQPNGLLCPEIAVNVTHKPGKTRRGRRGGASSDDSLSSN
jgi:hypothetical protein